MASRALVVPAVLVTIATAFVPFLACSRAGSTASSDANRTNADRDQDASRTDPAEANGNGPEDASSAAGDGGGEAPRDPGPPRVRLVGRFDTHDPSGPTCGWPG